MVFRHEWKHEINYSDQLAIRQRMKCVAHADAHAVDGKYLIRSLYFDTLSDRALREKTDGVSRREKFRIRYYNMDRSLIYLEKKSKVNGLGTKQRAILTMEQVQAILEHDNAWMRYSEDALVQELYRKMAMEGLLPRTIVDYMREPFLYGPGNVRVTLDSQIRTGMRSTDFLNPDCVTVPVRGNPIILEVKWDAFLPSVIRDAVGLKNRRAGAFSKYAACRAYD